MDDSTSNYEPNDTVGPWKSEKKPFRKPTCFIVRKKQSMPTPQLPRLTRFDQKGIDQLFQSQITRHTSRLRNKHHLPEIPKRMTLDEIIYKLQQVRKLALT